jgi:hypothetical protein
MSLLALVLGHELVLVLRQELVLEQVH